MTLQIVLQIEAFFFKTVQVGVLCKMPLHFFFQDLGQVEVLCTKRRSCMIG